MCGLVAWYGGRASTLSDEFIETLQQTPTETPTPTPAPTARHLRQRLHLHQRHQPTTPTNDTNDTNQPTADIHTICDDLTNQPDKLNR
jgi:hypothetical protein